MLLSSTLTIEKRGASTNYAWEVLGNEYKDGLICVQLGAMTLRRANGATLSTPCCFWVMEKGRLGQVGTVGGMGRPVIPKYLNFKKYESFGFKVRSRKVSIANRGT